MKVCMCVSIAGHAEPMYGLGDFSFSPGDVVDLHPDLAEAWLANGHAEAAPEEVAEEPEVKKQKRSQLAQENE